ncbi:MAG: glycoside hydrolase family 3 N-terminal domain-containing protein [Lachnospirales bacterium]
MKKNLKLSTRLLSSLAVFSLLVGVLGSCSPKEPEVTEDVPVVEEPEEEVVTETEGELPTEYPVAVDELGSGDVKWSEETTADGWNLVTNTDGKNLGYSSDSGVSLIQVAGYAFKDLNRNGQLDGYEDWRQTADFRASNLVSLLSAEDLTALMIHYSQFSIAEDGSDMTAAVDSGVRTVLSFATAFPTETQAKWNNAIQAQAESNDFGMPMNISTNPRIGSVWPSNLGLAATFDPELVFETSKEFAKEYRAIGINTLLGPQIDTSSEPRWSRIDGTFGEDPALSRDLTEAMTSGHQSTYDENGNDLGWGDDSVIAMIKHWPGDGSGESGRESHDFFGKYAVYPGGQFETHLIPFVDGGLNLTSSTETAYAVMTSYSVAYDDDNAYGELVGSAFSKYKIDLLRNTYGFEGVICTDWGTTAQVDEEGNVLTGIGMATGWGYEGEYPTAAKLTLDSFMAGIDQIGGEMDVNILHEAYQLGIEQYGEAVMLEKVQDSGRRILLNTFTVGTFENPYVDVEKSVEVIESEEKAALGYEALLKSAVLVKNANNAISAENATEEKQTIYIPMVFREGTAGVGALIAGTPSSATLPVDLEVASEYFNVITDTLSETLTGPADADGNPTVAYADIIRPSSAELAECDYTLTIVDSPLNVSTGITSKGYDGEKYIPISLQYGEYTADSDSVRKESLSGDLVIERIAGTYGTQEVTTKENRSYFGNAAKISNATDLDAILYASNNTPETTKNIVVIDSVNPTIVSEFESEVDAIIVGFNVNPKVYLDIVSGKFEPSGLLPFQMPANMETVEAQLEDVPRDMECYVDADGNTYDFAYGLNWSGVISDDRTAKYDVEPLVSPTN